jgi:hypothetical protein
VSGAKNLSKSTPTRYIYFFFALKELNLTNHGDTSLAGSVSRSSQYTYLIQMYAYSMSNTRKPLSRSTISYSITITELIFSNSLNYFVMTTEKYLRASHTIAVRGLIYSVSFPVLTAVSMKMTVFWDDAPCSLVETD